jgi:hypothetical protein
MDALKPCADFSSLEVQVLDGNFFQHSPISSTLKSKPGGKSLSSITFKSAVNTRIAAVSALAAPPLILMQ